MAFTRWNTDPRKARAAKAGDRIGSRNGLARERACWEDPAIINPRLTQLRAEREQFLLQLAKLDAPDRLSPADIDALLTELGGLAHILGEATPPEKASIYQGLGLHLVYQPDQHTLVATADLGRVLSRVGGGT